MKDVVAPFNNVLKLIRVAQRVLYSRSRMTSLDLDLDGSSSFITDKTWSHL